MLLYPEFRVTPSISVSTAGTRSWIQNWLKVHGPKKRMRRLVTFIATFTFASHEFLFLFLCFRNGIMFLVNNPDLYSKGYLYTDRQQQQTWKTMELIHFWDCVSFWFESNKCQIRISLVIKKKIINKKCKKKSLSQLLQDILLLLF